MDSGSSTSTAITPMAAISSTVQSEAARIQCCCGRPDCVFLKHNCSVLESVEKDVHAAAKMGQVLLARHEAYMADAERDRAELTTRIDQLETNKRDLEADNARTIEENRMLLNQLEALNSSVSDAETQISTLEAALQSSQLSIKRLEGAAVRAEQLERELEYLEREQDRIQSDLLSSQRDARNAIQRWKTAERGIANLQSQLERIEQEAREERERHAEVVERLERQRAVEKDLNAAAGRLKGAAAVKTLENGKGTNPVVSHFVRDLLQDNANLQLGIAELRELLTNSNDEIQMLREQLMYHQPVGEGEVSVASTLRAELGGNLADEELSMQTPTRKPLARGHAQQPSQELHIHHHYHVKPEPKKQKKKRLGLGASMFSPPMRSPSTPPATQWRMAQGSPAQVVLSHGQRDSVSTVPSNRWSVFSENLSDTAPSSVPTSPRSNYRNSLLGRGMLEEGESCPNSPLVAAGPMSPGWEGEVAHHGHHSLGATQGLQSQNPFPLLDAEDGSDKNSTTKSHHRRELDETFKTPETVASSAVNSVVLITEADSPVSSRASPPSLAISTDATNVESEDDNASITPTASIDEIPSSRRLHRATSHESIMSLSGGLDIHTLKMRPGQLTLRHLGTTAADTGLSAITASPTISRVVSGNGKRGSAVLRDSLSLGLPIPRSRVASAGQSPASSATSSLAGSMPRQPSSALGRLAAWRLWGGSSTSHSTKNPLPEIEEPSQATEPSATAPEAASPSPSPSAASSIATPSAKSPREAQKEFPRPAGINQAGAIPGFQEYFAAHQRRAPPSKVTPDFVDRDALKDVLDQC